MPPDVDPVRIALVGVQAAGLVEHPGERLALDRHRLDELDALAHAYFLLDWAHIDLGRPGEANYSQLALEIYERLGNLGRQATIWNNLGAFAYWGGRWQEALELYEKGRDLRLRLGDVVAAAMGTNNIGEILSDQGKLEEAEAHFRDALRICRAADYRLGILFCVSHLGKVASRAKRFDEAMSLLEEARRGFTEIGEEVLVLETEARIAECHLLKSESDRVLALTQKAVDLAGTSGGGGERASTLHRTRGYALMQLGRPEEAEAALAESPVRASRTLGTATVLVAGTSS
jgi:tetratricopeptide (TPR) repeat protein